VPEPLPVRLVFEEGPTRRSGSSARSAHFAPLDRGGRHIAARPSGPSTGGLPSMISATLSPRCGRSCGLCRECDVRDPRQSEIRRDSPVPAFVMLVRRSLHLAAAASITDDLLGGLERRSANIASRHALVTSSNSAPADNTKWAGLPGAACQAVSSCRLDSLAVLPPDRPI